MVAPALTRSTERTEYRHIQYRVQLLPDSTAAELANHSSPQNQSTEEYECLPEVTAISDWSLVSLSRRAQRHCPISRDDLSWMR